MRRRGTIRAGLIAPLLALIALLAAAPAATAAPACVNSPQAQTLYSGYGTLESAIVDDQGRLYFTDTANDRVMRADSPGATPVPWATGISEPGGMAFDPVPGPGQGDLLVGYGDGVATGLQANLGNPQAGIVRVNKTTGAVTPYASGTQMSNGVAVASDGTLFASSDVGFGVDRVDPVTHTVELRWASVISSNGLAIDAAEQYMYINQTFQPAAIARVKLDDPSTIATWFQAPPEDIAGGPDGLEIDENDNLYVAANGGGQIWKVTNPDRRVCSLASMPAFPDGPSAVAFGKGTSGFSADSLYVVTFSGDVIALPGARAATPPPGAPSGAPAAEAVYSGPSARRKCKRHRKHRHGKRRRCRHKRKRGR